MRPGSAWSAATGSTTTSSTRSNGRNLEFNVAKAKQLMGEAGFPNGFNVDWLTPVPPLLFARRARDLAAAGDRHPAPSCRPWSAASS